MTRRDHATVTAKVDQVIAIVSRYAAPTTPPNYLPSPDAKLEGLMEKLAKL